jgi:hypothetical protein
MAEQDRRKHRQRGAGPGGYQQPDVPLRYIPAPS